MNRLIMTAEYRRVLPKSHIGKAMASLYQGRRLDAALVKMRDAGFQIEYGRVNEPWVLKDSMFVTLNRR